MSNWNQGPDITSDGVSSVVTVADVGTPHVVGDKIKIFGVSGAETLNNFIFTFISIDQIDLAEHGLAILPAATYNIGGAYTLDPEYNACGSVLSANAHVISSIDAAQSVGEYSAKNLEHDNRGTVYKRDPAPLNYESGDRLFIMSMYEPITGGTNSLPLYDVGNGVGLNMLIDGNTSAWQLWNAEVVSGAGFGFFLDEPAVIKTIRFQIDFQGGYPSPVVIMDNIKIYGYRKNSTVRELLNGGVNQTLTPIGGFATLNVGSNQAYIQFEITGVTKDWSVSDPAAGLLELREFSLINYNDRLSVDFGSNQSVDVIAITDILTNSDARFIVSGQGRDGGTYYLYTPIDLLRFGDGTAAELPMEESVTGEDRSFNLVLNLPPLFDNIINLDFIDVTGAFQCSGIHFYESMGLDSAGVFPSAKITYKSLDSLTVVSNNALRKEISGDMKTLSFEYVEKNDTDQSLINKALRDKRTVVIDLFPNAGKEKRNDNIVVGVITDNKSSAHNNLRGSFKLSVIESKGK